MAQITFIQPDGGSETIAIENGVSIMEGATAHGVAGIVAECGGCCSCSTCHCYVAPEWFDRLPPMSADESSLVEFAWEPKENSRLGCQLIVDDSLDGLVLHVPERQI